MPSGARLSSPVGCSVVPRAILHEVLALGRQVTLIFFNMVLYPPQLDVMCVGLRLQVGDSFAVALNLGLHAQLEILEVFSGRRWLARSRAFSPWDLALEPFDSCSDSSRRARKVRVQLLGEFVALRVDACDVRRDLLHLVLDVPDGTLDLVQLLLGIVEVTLQFRELRLSDLGDVVGHDHVQAALTFNA